MGIPNYNLPPGCRDSDLPGDVEHYKECPVHEDAEYDADAECVCRELDKDLKAEADELAFDCMRDVGLL